jgi:hypothetical protein
VTTRGDAGPTGWLLSPVIPVVLFAALAVTSMVHKSATFDEALHLVSGAHFVRTGDPTLNVEHPPLVKAWCALPTLVLPHSGLPDPPATVLGTYRIAHAHAFANDYLYSFDDPRAVLFWCRTMAVLLGCALGVLIYGVARRTWDPSVALALLWIYSLSPNLLANTRLIMMDVGSALFLLAAVVALYRLLVSGGVGWAATTGLALAGALLTRHATAPVLVVVAVVALVCALLRRRFRTRFPLELAGAGGLALLVLNLVYGFEGFARPLADGRFLSPLFTSVQQVEWLARLPLPVPFAWVQGLDIAGFWNQPGEFNIFLGRAYLDGGSWWYYYLVELALRVPLPLLAGVLMSLAIVARGGQHRLRTAFFVVPPVVVLLIFSLASYRQLGLRYILPVWPFMILGLGFLVERVRRHWGRTRYRGTAVVLAGWYLASSLLVYPHYLTYFNELAGGSANGWRLADANYDWCQDLPLLGRWQEEHGWPSLYLLSFGPTPPDQYGVVAQPWGSRPLPEYLAIGATMRLLLADDPLVQAITAGREPVARLGNTIFIFDIPRGVDRAGAVRLGEPGRAP